MILAGVAAFQQLPSSVALAAPDIMTGGDHVRAQAQRVIEKGGELDLPVAQRIGVGRAAFFCARRGNG